jgi:hypothetical protein
LNDKKIFGYNTTKEDATIFYLSCAAKVIINFANPYTPKAFQHEIFEGEWAKFMQGEDGRTDRVWVHWDGIWLPYATYSTY